MSALLAGELDHFRAQPDDARAFDAIEERLFVAGEWRLLADLYEARLGAASVGASPRERARVFVRLGRVLAEHLDDPVRAESCFRSALSAEARHRPALAGLRRLHSARERFDVALQIAELELSLEMPAEERATLLCDVGSIWIHRLGDAELALRHFREALETRPQHGGALAGSALALESLGRAAEAAASWERAATVLRGPARAEAMAAQARLLARSLGEPERAAELCRRALTEDPRRADALELLTSLVEAAGQWPLLVDLLERRFEVESDAGRRGAIALRAGRLQLERLASPPAARHWLERAEACLPGSADLEAAFVDLERACGDEAALALRLARWVALVDLAPASALVELAALLADREGPEAALPHLKRALELAPEDTLVVDALAEALAQLGLHAELADCLERRAALVGSDPGLRAGILVELGALYEERLDDPEAARGTYERALDADPTTPGLVARIVRHCHKTEAWAALRHALEYAAREGPADERASHWCSLGELLALRFDDPRGAADCFEAALALDPTAMRAHRGRQALAAARGDAAAVLAAYECEAAVATDRGRLGFLVQEIARRLEERGRLAEAPRWVLHWTQACPEEVAALELAVEIAHKLGLVQDELRALERLDPHLGGAARAALRRRVAEIHAASGRHGEAIDACRGALAAEAGDLAAHALLVRELEGEGRLEEAAAARRAQLPLLADAERPAALDLLARLQAERLGDLAGAIASLARLASEPGAPPDVDARLEDLLARSERFEELAERLERRRAAQAPGDPEWEALALRRAAILLEPLGRSEAAADLYAEVQARDPHCAEARLGLERALRASGNVPGLVAFLAAQAEAHPDRATRERAALERAALLEDLLHRPAEAAPQLQALFERAADAATREAAGARLERLLERERDWPALRSHLQAKLAAAPEAERGATHERLGRLCRDRVADAAAATQHFEAAAALAPERPDLWHGLARLYEEADRPADLARALEAELATAPSPERERAIRSRVAHLAASTLAEPERARAHYERLLELDPGDVAASEFLVAHFEREGRAGELVRVLERRLEAFGSRYDADAASRTALRMRIAGLRATRLGDATGAIALLEPVLAELGPVAGVAEPLADLYQRTGDAPALEALCRAAADRAAEGAERAGWLSRLGDALRARGADREAVAAYRRVLTERPGDRDASAALRELYRRLGEPEPLARLLEAELAHRAGPAEVPVRMELARLLALGLERPGDALLHLRRVLQIEPGHAEALERAFELARARPQAGLLREIVDEALARPQPDATRAALLAQRARLRAADPGRGREAAADLRESFALDPSRREVRDALREELERIGDFSGLLECLRAEIESAAPGARASLLVKAVRIAWRRIAPDAALPWLEWLRREQPERPEIAAHVAEIHRLAGRTEAHLRALEDQEALSSDAAERRALCLERARILEGELGSPARAAAALAEARRAWPGDPQLLGELARLLAALGRDRERAEVALERLAGTEGEPRLRLLREAAELWAGPLGDPGRAAQLWMQAVELVPEPGARRAELLRSLGVALRPSAPSEVWARCAEAELESLDASDPVFAERRQALHGDLAQVYRRIGRPDAALRHLRPLVDAPEAERSRELEAALLGLLRGAGAWIELQQRWTAHLERWPDAEGWIELARLLDEQLHSPARAAEAYRRSLALFPRSLPALRGLRAAAERIGDWVTAAEALEGEIECASDAPPTARAALLRRLGDLAWHRLQATPRASRCYAAALEADPQDFASLRALEALLEAMEDWAGAARLYESEVEVLGSREPERRQAAWLRAGELARDHLGDRPGARRAYLAAAALGPLPLPHRAELAELQQHCGDLEGFVESFAAWCDHPESGATAADQRRLASSLEELGRLDLALARVERALALEPNDSASLDLAAHLYERAGRLEPAISALERGASFAPDTEAATRLARAAELSLASSPDRAAEFLRTAATRNPASVAIQARLARIEARRNAAGDAEAAARRALELAAVQDLSPEERLELALLGGRCARQRGRLEAAARFYSEARRSAPDDPEALVGSAEVLAGLDDFPAARDAIERRLALADAYPERAAHLALLARCLEATGDLAGSLARCEAALALDPAHDDAHARCVRLHESADRIDAGVAALERWASAAPDPERRAERLLRAAEWEMRVPGREEAAERHFRGVLEANPASALAWQGLAWLLWHRGDVDAALAVANEALANGANDSARGPLALVRGRALERQGARADAAEAYAVAVSADPRCLEAALARARLLRALGDWRGAAEALRRFVELHPGDDPRGIAEALQQQGRLLAGPLEDLEGAVAAYERAIRLDPEATELRAVLASLLSHRPERWHDALGHLLVVLERDPTHAQALRAALRVAASRPRPHAGGDGLAILRALGIATSSELAAAPAGLSIRIAGGATLDDPLHEKLRLVAEQAAREIGDALGHSGPPPPPAGDPLAAFRAAVFAAEGQLSAPALLSLPTRELRELLLVVATLALEGEELRASGRHVNALTTALGRRTRRGLRRLLEGVSLDALAAVDFAAWRSELRALAAAVALDATRADLRTALVALVAETSEGAAQLPATADLSPAVAASPEARKLLRRAILAWLARL